MFSVCTRVLEHYCEKDIVFFYWFHVAGLSCLLSSHLVPPAAAVPEDSVPAAGAQPGSVLRRLSAKRQPDLKRNCWRDLSGEAPDAFAFLLPFFFTLPRCKNSAFLAFIHLGWGGGCAFVSGGPSGSTSGLLKQNAVNFLLLFFSRSGSKRPTAQSQSSFLRLEWN